MKEVKILSEFFQSPAICLIWRDVRGRRPPKVAAHTLEVKEIN